MDHAASQLPVVLMQAREAVVERYRPVLVRHSLTEQQWRVLRTLHVEGQLDATRLAARAGIAPPSLTRMTQSMDRRGLITTRRDPQDGRRALLRLTEDGSALVEQLSPEIERAESAILNGYGAERAEALMRALKALRGSLDRAG